MFGYGKANRKGVDDLNPSRATAERPVFVVYEPARTGEVRPFHHAYLVVGSRGSGAQMDANSKGTTYDRFGAKGEKTTFAANPERFEGLKSGEWAVFQGWTNKTNEAIQSTVDGIEVESYLLEQNYSVWANNCQHYAKQLAAEIVTRQP